MGVIATVILCLILVCIIWFIQQTLQLAAYRFYPFVAIGLLVAAVFWLISPREATSTFIQAGQYLEYVVNSTLSEACRQGAEFFCPLVNR